MAVCERGSGAHRGRSSIRHPWQTLARAQEPRQARERQSARRSPSKERLWAKRRSPPAVRRSVAAWTRAAPRSARRGRAVSPNSSADWTIDEETLLLEPQCMPDTVVSSVQTRTSALQMEQASAVTAALRQKSCLPPARKKSPSESGGFKTLTELSCSAVSVFDGDTAYCCSCRQHPCRDRRKDGSLRNPDTRHASCVRRQTVWRATQGCARIDFVSRASSAGRRTLSANRSAITPITSRLIVAARRVASI